MKEEDKGRFRAYCWTLNNYTAEDEKRIQGIECQFLQYGREIAPTTGTPHLQGYIYFTNQKAFNVVRKFIGGHLVPCKGSPQSNITYTGKEANVFTKGEPPKDQSAQGELERERWDAARQAAAEGRFQDIPSQMYIRYQASFKRIRLEDSLPEPKNLDSRDYYGIWIWGPPRVGKSHYARTNYPDAYLKDKNKWWGGYRGEKTIIIDELSPQHTDMAAYIKVWVDKWTFTAETKGGQFVIRPELVVITSNYPIERCFALGEDIEAIKARFKVIHITERIIAEVES